MRFGLLALCSFLALQVVALGQNQPPSFTAHPASVSAFVGEAVTLSVTAEGSAPVTLQWQKDSSPIPGAVNPTFTLAATQLTDTALYNVVATNSFGTVTSFSGSVLVSKRPQSITFMPTVTTTVAGSGLTLAATASSTLPVALTLISGSATLNGTSIVGLGGNVVVRAAQAGNDFYAAADPVERTFTFVVGALSPFITSPPLDQTVNAGAAVTLQAAAIGTPAPAYQWQKNGIDLAGATASALRFATATLADTGRYTITATNLAGTASASATLTVRSAPIINAAPASRTVSAGDSVTFTVAVTATPAPTYQWRKNGTAIPGATRNTFTLASAFPTDAGRFDVVASNTLGSVASAVATLTVNSRDFSGAYFDQFSDSTGNFALFVRPDRTAVFIGHIPGRQTAVAALNLRVDLGGNFSLSLPTLAATPQSVTLRGTLNDETGSVTGSIIELGVTFSATRAARTGTSLDNAGYYQLGLIGSATGRAFAIVAADGQAMLLTSGAGAPDAARATVTAAGRLLATTAAQSALDLVFASGGVAGILRPNLGATTNLLGVADTRAGTERLINLSVRSVTAPATPLIAGFVITGTTAKLVLVRAAGPALAPAPFNVPNALVDPVLQLLRGNTAIAQNDDWGVPAANTPALTAATTRAGAFPFRAGSGDAALLTTLASGAYTATIGGGTGVTLAEVYEVLETAEVVGARRLINVSARGLVTPAAPFIAGFVINGIGPQRVLLRGVGPTLGTPVFGVAGVLPNPELTLFGGTTAVKTNDDWFRDPDAAAIRDTAVRVGAFALGAASADAAILIFLEPGAYTVQVNAPANTPPANTTGIALLEIYEAAP